MANIAQGAIADEGSTTKRGQKVDQVRPAPQVPMEKSHGRHRVIFQEKKKGSPKAMDDPECRYGQSQYRGEEREMS